MCQKVFVRHIEHFWAFLNDWWLLLTSLSVYSMYADDTVRAKHDQGNMSDSTHRISVTSNALLPFTQQDRDTLHCVIKCFNYITNEYQCLCSQNACVCWWHNSLLISIPNAANSIWSFSPFGPGEVLYGSLHVKQLIHVLIKAIPLSLSRTGIFLLFLSVSSQSCLRGREINKDITVDMWSAESCLIPQLSLPLATLYRTAVKKLKVGTSSTPSEQVCTVFNLLYYCRAAEAAHTLFCYEWEANWKQCNGIL